LFRCILFYSTALSVIVALETDDFLRNYNFLNVDPSCIVKHRFL
jgi:hypothetical protein